MATLARHTGITQILPSTTFDATTGDILIDCDDVHNLTTDEVGGSSADSTSAFSVSWYGATGGGYTEDGTTYAGGGSATAYTGNFEKFLWGLLKTYNTKITALQALYDTDQALETPLGTTRPPTAFTQDMGSLSGGGSSAVKQTFSFTATYDLAATTDLQAEAGG